MDLRLRNQFQFDTMSTRIIREYYSEDPQARAAAKRELVELYGDAVREAVRAVRHKFGYIREDVGNEGWLRGFSALDANKERLLRPRPERLSTSKLWRKAIVGSRETLQQRERRAEARKAPVSEDTGQFDQAYWVASFDDLKLSTTDLRIIFQRSWQSVLSESAEANRERLLKLGMGGVFAEEEPKPGDLQLITDARARMHAQLPPVLKAAGLSQAERKQFMAVLTKLSSPLPAL